MSKNSTFETKFSKVLGNQLKLMYAIKAPIRSQMKINKKTMEAINDTRPTSEPAVRILKRPSHLARGQVIGVNYTEPKKELEQRKREYEEARKRILGEAHNPEDDDDHDEN